MRFISIIALVTFYTGTLFTSLVLASSKTSVELNTAVPALTTDPGIKCEDTPNTVHSIWWVGKSPLFFWNGSTWNTVSLKGMITTWREPQSEPGTDYDETIAFSNAQIFPLSPIESFYEIRLVEAEQTSECEVQGSWTVELNGKNICTQCYGEFYSLPTFFSLYISALDDNSKFRELYLVGSSDGRVNY